MNEFLSNALHTIHIISFMIYFHDIFIGFRYLCGWTNVFAHTTSDGYKMKSQMSMVLVYVHAHWWQLRNEHMVDTAFLILQYHN